MNPKTNKTIIWILIALLTLQFLAAGLAKFRGAWTDRFVEWGYPEFLVYVIGAVEVLAVVGLLISKFRKWAVLLLIVTMLGAAVTHVLNDELSRLIHNGILIALLGTLYYLDKRVQPSTSESLKGDSEGEGGDTE